MAKWEISFSRINEDNIRVDAESEADAILKAMEEWHTENPNIPQINYICNIDEQWGRPIK